MAGTLTVTPSRGRRGVTEYLLSWVSDVSGNVDTNNFELVHGYVEAVKFVPDSGGTQPTNLYDVTLTDGNSIDLLTGLGADLSNTTSNRSKPLVNTSGPLWFEGGTVDLVVSNAGNAKGGTVHIWIRGID